MYHVTMKWFACAGCTPRGGIELGYTETIKSLVAAGYGAAILPVEHGHNCEIHSGIQVIPVRPTLMRHIGVAHRPLSNLDGAARNLLMTLALFRQNEQAPDENGSEDFYPVNTPRTED
jgi:DNA-binding transcriptional LysR family regulator